MQWTYPTQSVEGSSKTVNCRFSHGKCQQIILAHVQQLYFSNGKKIRKNGKCRHFNESQYRYDISRIYVYPAIFDVDMDDMR